MVDKKIVEPEFANQLRMIFDAFSSPGMAARIHDCGGCLLENFPDTRWCFLRRTCEGIWKSIHALRDVAEIEDVKVPENVKDLIISLDFERKLINTIRTVTRVCKLINNFQNPKIDIADGTEQWLSLKLDTTLMTKKLKTGS